MLPGDSLRPGQLVVSQESQCSKAARSSPSDCDKNVTESARKDRKIPERTGRYEMP